MPISIYTKPPTVGGVYYNARAAEQFVELLLKWQAGGMKPLTIYCEDVQLELATLRQRLYAAGKYIKDHPSHTDANGVTTEGYSPEIIALAEACTFRTRKEPRPAMVMLKLSRGADILASAAQESAVFVTDNIEARNLFWAWTQEEHEPLNKITLAGPHSGADIAFYREQSEAFREHYLFKIHVDAVTVIYFPDMTL